MLNNLIILFIIMTSLGSIISVSSVSWFTAWMGLELNMLSFIPVLANNKNILSTETAMKYFLIQSSASALFIYFCILESYFNFTFFFSMQDYSKTLLISLPLLIKLGAFPFHSWFIIIFNGLDWFKSLMIMTLQKMAPLFLLNNLSQSLILIFFVSYCTTLVGAIGGLTQTSLKMILAFSSVNHLGWMMIASMLNKSILIFYLIFYSLMNLFSISWLQNKNIFQFNQLHSLNDLIYWAINILSLCGLPPFIGFLPKWMVIQMLLSKSYFVTSFILILSSLITLIFYLRLIISSLIFKAHYQKWMFYFKTLPNYSVYFSFMVTATSFGLILFNLILT